MPFSLKIDQIIQVQQKVERKTILIKQSDSTLEAAQDQRHRALQPLATRGCSWNPPSKASLILLPPTGSKTARTSLL